MNGSLWFVFVVLVIVSWTATSLFYKAGIRDKAENHDTAHHRVPRPWKGGFDFRPAESAEGCGHTAHRCDPVRPPARSSRGMRDGRFRHGALSDSRPRWEGNGDTEDVVFPNSRLLDARAAISPLRQENGRNVH